MFECENIRRISAYHDGQLSAQEAQELADHVRHCPHCGQELARLRAVSAWLSSAPAPAMPSGALRRVRRGVWARRDRAALRMAGALTAAAAGVVLACAAMLWQGRSMSPVLPASPAKWETAAVEPTPFGPAPAASGFDAGGGQDADIELARLILGALPDGGVRGHE